MSPGSSAEGESPKGMIGILGESVTFPLRSPKLFDAVLWFRNEIQVASLRWMSARCQLWLSGPYESRDVTVSRVCSSLTVGGLREGDSAEYKAQMLNNFQVVEWQIFILKVYKRLSGADLEVACAREILSNGSEILHLNCSAGKWGDGAEFSWASSGQSDKVSSSEKSLLVFDNPQDDDGSVACMAENPVGRASRTVSLKQPCAGNSLSGVTIGVTIATLIAAKVIISACVFARWPPCTKKEEILPSLAQEEGVSHLALSRRDL